MIGPFLAVLGSALVVTARAITDQRDVYALYQVKAEVHGRSDEWNGVVDTWFGDDPCGDTSRSDGAYMSSWVGVQCRFQSDLPADAVRVVTNIHIPKRGLGGTLPKAFGMLRHLRELDMDHDNYHGPLPPEWGCLKDLKELDLAGNPGLSGEIPPEWGNLVSLVDLKLTNNSGIYGCLPDGLPSFEVKCGPPPAPTCPTFTDDPLVGTLQAGTQLKQYCWQEEQAEALKNGTLHSDDVDALALKKRLVPKHVPPVVCPPVPVGPMPVEAGVSLTKHVPGSAEGFTTPEIKAQEKGQFNHSQETNISNLKQRVEAFSGPSQ